MQALHVYATNRLHLASIDAEVADSRGEATELLDMLFDQGLQGMLAFDLPEDATEEQVIRYLKKRLRWMCATMLQQDVWTVGDEALDELPDPTPDAFERLSGLRLVQHCKQALEHDAEASAFLEQLGEDKPRAGIAAALGWTVQRVKVVRNRIARTLATLTAREDDMDDDAEDEPPSSGPRGDYDVPAAQVTRRWPPGGRILPQGWCFVAARRA
jgi:hypothetical protein